MSTHLDALAEGDANLDDMPSSREALRSHHG